MNQPFKITSLGPTLVIVVLQAACARDPMSDRNVKYFANPTPLSIASSVGHTIENVSYWDGDGVFNAPAIGIHLAEQRAYFFKGGVLVGISQISTGREGHNTGPGTFRIIQRDRDDRSSSYGNFVAANHPERIIRTNVSAKDPRPVGSLFPGTPMPNFLRLTDEGIGMHAGYLPGLPASHGCIRMPAPLAEDFFDNAPLGTPVVIKP